MATKRTKTPLDIELQRQRIADELEYRKQQDGYRARQGITESSDYSSRNLAAKREGQRRLDADNRRLARVNSAARRYIENGHNANSRLYSRMSQEERRAANRKVGGFIGGFVNNNPVPREQYMGIASKSNVGG